MLSMKPRRSAALALAVLCAVVLAAPVPARAINWGKGQRARVVLPQAAENDPNVTAFRDSVVAGVDKNPGKNANDANRDRRKPSADPLSDNPDAGSGAPSSPPPPPPPPVVEPQETPKEQEKQEKKEKWSFFSKKTDLQKKQDELESAKKDFDRKKFKKALEKSCQIVSDIREHGYDKVGSDGKGKDAELYKELLNQALSLAQKSGGRVDEPIVAAGVTGKTLYFVF